MKLYKNYIDGKWLESESKDIIQVDDPATGKVIGEISCAKKNEVDLAVSAAKAAFKSRVLVDMPLLERAKLMHRIADETRKIADEGGKMLCYENGKMLGAAIKEFNDVADMFDYYAGLTDKLEGKTIPVSPTIFDYTVLEPFGVSAHIVPWNFPISMVGRSLACSFATGNSTIVKTAELTPLSATFFAKAIENAGSLEMAFLEKNMGWLTAIVAIAPMMGFTGTVWGMIGAFEAIEAANDISPAVVAGGISQALLTTAFGLVVAMIIQVCQNYFSSQIDAMVLDMEEKSIELTDLLTSK